MILILLRKIRGTELNDKILKRSNKLFHYLLAIDFKPNYSLLELNISFQTIWQFFKKVKNIGMNLNLY